MRAFVVISIAGATACSFQAPEVTGDDIPTNEAGPDARTDAPAGDPCNEWTFLPTEFDPCTIPDPVLVTLGVETYSIDSDTGVLTGSISGPTNLPYQDVNGIGIVSVTELSVPTGATVRAVGTRPLVIASWSTITVSGTITVASRHVTPPTLPPTVELGAGANSPSCPTGSSAPQRGAADLEGDGGGGGGGFAADGGDGGDGGSGSAAKGAKGSARNRPPTIEGGCAGATAAEGANGTPGSGGGGGGAIALIARDTITVAMSGKIDAGGAGGGGGSTGATGGGGGGAGGMIKLETSSLTIATGATLAANGGQGGGGCNNNTAGVGSDGRLDDLQALVANKEAGGTTGGGGGYDQDAAGAPVIGSGNDGGGGGGGGVGFIVYKGHASSSVASDATMSPDGLGL